MVLTPDGGLITDIVKPTGITHGLNLLPFMNLILGDALILNMACDAVSVVTLSPVASEPTNAVVPAWKVPKST